ncbi:MAG: hypothetical protein ACE5F9_02075 [Phycisphaerae bacterium]
MTDVDRPDDVEGYDVHDAKETSRAGDFRYAPAAGSTPLAQSRDPEGPVPSEPPHLCPWCDYNLAGLTARRCPECNKPFTLAEARRRGSEQSEETRQDYRSIRHDRYRLATGTVLFVAGLTGSLTGARFLALRLWVMGTLYGTMAVLVVMYKVFFQKPWSHAMLIMGLLSFALCVLIRWL